MHEIVQKDHFANCSNGVQAHLTQDFGFVLVFTSKLNDRYSLAEGLHQHVSRGRKSLDKLWEYRGWFILKVVVESLQVRSLMTQIQLQGKQIRKFFHHIFHVQPFQVGQDGNPFTNFDRHPHKIQVGINIGPDVWMQYFNGHVFPFIRDPFADLSLVDLSDASTSQQFSHLDALIPLISEGITQDHLGM